MKKIFKYVINFFKNLFKKKVKETVIEEEVNEEVIDPLVRSREIMGYHDGMADDAGKLYSESYVEDLKASAKTHNIAKDSESNFNGRLHEKGLVGNHDEFKAASKGEEAKDKTKLIRTEMDLKYKNK